MIPMKLLIGPALVCLLSCGAHETIPSAKAPSPEQKKEPEVKLEKTELEAAL